MNDDGADPLGWAFGALGIQDRARHLATLYLNDLADVIKDGVDPRFEFVRYGESLAASQAFAPAVGPTIRCRVKRSTGRERNSTAGSITSKSERTQRIESGILGS